MVPMDLVGWGAVEGQTDNAGLAAGTKPQIAD